MGLFDKIFGGRKEQQQQQHEHEMFRYFETLTGYAPVFTSFEGGLYEMELTRAAVHSFANFISKLRPVMHGSARRDLERVLSFAPNPFMDTGKFLYRLATILSVNNNAFISPILGQDGGLIGYYPILPSTAEVVTRGGEAYLRYTFADGQAAAIEYDKVGILTQFQYDNDFFGSGNGVLTPTLELMDLQKKGIKQAVNNSAHIRFFGKISNTLKPEKLKAERERFARDNFTDSNKSGLILADGTYAELKQIEHKPYTVDPAQTELINRNVFNYFGTNENILQNKFTEEEWNAYYEGKVQPFAMQLSLVLSNMTFTERELAHGNKITLSTSDLQFMSNNTKMDFSTQFVDRGIATPNEARALWGLPPLEGGDTPIIRREYVPADLLGMADLKLKNALNLDNDTNDTDNTDKEEDE